MFILIIGKFQFTSANYTYIILLARLSLKKLVQKFQFFTTFYLLFKEAMADRDENYGGQKTRVVIIKIEHDRSICIPSF